ncbi:lantibiotic dehydratase [Chryseobacterium sp.]|uniref:lantibiotic dehydratase n=1 Tax=Chryseobacterium sp. TaxID=1871047 RepID=UPI0024E1EFB8|nr:lantibiotic dehydratase [Chryseobacterium sp.]
MSSKQYTPFHYTILRTPVLSPDDLDKFYSSSDVIENISCNDAIMDAIKLSSLNFYNEVTKEFSKKNPEQKEKLQISLYKYLSRYTTRPTPFGLFSGLGTLKTSSEITDKKIYWNTSHPRLRLDSDYVYKAVNSLEKHESYLTNNTLYEIFDEYKYLQCYTGVIGRDYRLVTIESNEYIGSVIEFCRSEKTSEEIIHYIKEENDVTHSEAEDFFNELKDEQIINSSLSYSGTETGNLINKIYKNVDIPGFNELKEYIDKSNQGNNIPEILSLPDQKKVPLHVDLYFETSNTMSQKFIEDIQKSDAIFERFSILENQTPYRITNFKKQFSKKYEQQEVNLLHALDIEFGVGYGKFANSENIDSSTLILGWPNESIKEDNLSLNRKEVQYSHAIIDCIKNKKNSIDLHVLSKNQEVFLPEKMNPSFPFKSYKASIFFDKETNNPVYFIDYISFHSPRKILGRFSDHKEIGNLLDDIHDHEKKIYGEDTVIAEIVHLPSEKIGNVIERKINTEYYIGYIDESSSRKKIHLNDLYISIVNDRIVLRSKVLNKYVIPVFSNAYNIMHPTNSPIFEFLLDFQTQQNHSLLINEEKLLDIFKFFPRLQKGNFIVKKAAWLIEYHDFFSNKNTSVSEALTAFDENLQKLNITKNFFISEGDNELYIHLKFEISKKTFLTELKKKQKLKIIESLLDEFTPVTYNHDGNTVNNEFLLFFKNEAQHQKEENFLPVVKTSDIPRSLFPDIDNCLYLKIYTGKVFADFFICETVGILSFLQANKLIEKFFYIKFYDPEFHIRLRIFAPKTNHEEVKSHINALIKKYLAEKIQRISYDTYDRELERYEGNNTKIFEKIFYYDSLVSAAIIEKNIEEDNTDILWMYPIKHILFYCKVFNLDTESQLNFVSGVKSSLAREFNTSPLKTAFINAKYKGFSEEIENIISEKNDILSAIHTQFFKDIQVDLPTLQGQNSYKNLANIIHMHIIRVVRSDNRLHEYLMYCFLEKILKKQFFSLKTNANTSTHL